MDVKLPDGTIITNVPDGITQSELMSRLGKEKSSSSMVEDIVGGVTEPLAKMATGIIAKPASELAGLAAAAMGGDDVEGWKNHFQNSLTYEPRTDAGKSAYNPLNAIPEAIAKVVGGVGNLAGDTISDGNASSLRGMVGNAVREAIPQAVGFLGVTKPASVISAAKTAAKPITATADAIVNVADRLLPGGASRGQARVMTDAAGGQIPALVAALRAAQPGETAGQAIVGTGNRTFAALDQLSSKIKPNEYGQMMDAQQAAALDSLLKNAGSLTKEEQMVLQAAYKEAETKALVAQGQTELNAANIAGNAVRDLTPMRDSALIDAATSVNDVRRFTAAAPRAFETPMATNFVPIPGQPRVSASLNPRANQLAQMAEDTVSAAADSSLTHGADARLVDSLIGRMADNGLKPLDVSAVIKKIDDITSTPGLRQNDQAVTVLNGVKDKLQKAVEDGNGIPNAHDIYEIRKSGINQVITDKLKITDPKVANKVAAELTAKLKPLIDDAIDTAGGTGWKQYLADYSKAMDRVGQLKLAGEMAYRFKNSPESFRKLAWGNDPKAVGKIMQSTSPMALSEAAPADASLYRSLVDKMERDARLQQLSQEGAPALSGMVTAEVTGGGRLPGMVSRETTWANAILDALHGKANERTLKLTADTMRNPAAVANVLEKALRKQQVKPPSVFTQNAVRATLAPQDREKLAKALRGN